jgi:hypothetical protein
MIIHYKYAKQRGFQELKKHKNMWLMMMMKTMDESAVVKNRFASRLKIPILKEDLAAENSTFHRRIPR